MTWLRRQWLPLTVLVVAAGLLVSSIAWVTGAGQVRSLDDARRAAARFGDRWGLTVGEVMQFDNGFYAELAEPSGSLATEVLVDPVSGRVQLEYGPAMMWNTAYGMHAGRAEATTVSAGQATDIADRWLEANRPGEHAGDAEAFPGYYTLHTLRDDQVVGMLSVHATTGDVWYHSWHGRFIDMTE
jgi:hypothetical protein